MSGDSINVGMKLGLDGWWSPKSGWYVIKRYIESTINILYIKTRYIYISIKKV